MKHGLTGHPIYTTHSKMMRRCYEERNNRFYRYGARGIKVCPEWHDLKEFAKWAFANGFEHGLQLDRINNDGDYEPDNCRFVTQSENIRNRPYTITRDQAEAIYSSYIQGERVDSIANRMGYNRSKVFRLIRMIKHNKETSA